MSSIARISGASLPPRAFSTTHLIEALANRLLDRVSLDGEILPFEGLLQLGQHLDMNFKRKTPSEEFLTVLNVSNN